MEFLSPPNAMDNQKFTVLVKNLVICGALWVVLEPPAIVKLARLTPATKVAR